MHSSTGQYHRRKDELYRALGGVCSVCGGTDRLGVDHVNGRDYLLRALGSHRRMRRYLEEFRAGVPLRLLCWECDGMRNGSARKYVGFGLVPLDTAS